VVTRTRNPDDFSTHMDGLGGVLAKDVYTQEGPIGLIEDQLDQAVGHPGNVGSGIPLEAPATDEVADTTRCGFLLGHPHCRASITS
jgi:hypothetical protein